MTASPHRPPLPASPDPHATAQAGRQRRVAGAPVPPSPDSGHGNQVPAPRRDTAQMGRELT